MQKNLALLAKYFKRLYKPTNNNLRTSSNSRNKTEDTIPRYTNDNQSGQFRNQRTMTVAGARETVGSPVVQQNRIQCFNCKGFGHYAKECRKPKAAAPDVNEIDDRKWKHHLQYMAMIHESHLKKSILAVQHHWNRVQKHDESNCMDNVRQPF
ncbi:5'-methylthioadenosine/S-adenosylhomocysteine nucleosidase 2-like protein [Tanacetum coccineum]|uniref:5'-methylthioadenosine/S-adenosylhomocysteine nucleosidase 2-like protein n=1 Tax=Tanacetum coccineum TaxID=301880 RepID=A0ABQ5AD79_9ASTR